MDKTPSDIHDRADRALREGIMLQTGLALLAQNGGNEGGGHDPVDRRRCRSRARGHRSRGIALGILLIIGGLLVGPGGVSILD